MDTQEWISAGLDGRLAAREASALSDHLQSCPACRGRRDVLAAQRRALSTRYREARAPERLVTRAEAILAGRKPGRDEARPDRWDPFRRRWFYLLPAGALAGFFALLGLLAWILLAPRGDRAPPVPSDRALAQALLTGHAGWVEESSRDRIASSDPAVVRSWFSGRVPFAVQVPALADGSLLGGRMASLDGLACAQLVYDRAGTLVSIFEIGADAVAFKAPPLARRLTAEGGRGAAFTDRGYTLRVFESRGVVFAAAAALSEDELLRLVPRP